MLFDLLIWITVSARQQSVWQSGNLKSNDTKEWAKFGRGVVLVGRRRSPLNGQENKFFLVGHHRTTER